MYADGMSIPAIAKKLGIRYAFAYQVIQRDLLVEGKPMETHTVHGPKKTLQMIELHKQGLTKGEIAKSLNANYVFVWRTITDYVNRQAAKVEEPAE
jgi:DNA-binding ferritin-like protein (Dps family)